MEKTMILTEIQEAIALCREAGRKPVALLVSPEILNEIDRELKMKMGSSQTTRGSTREVFGITVFRHPKVKDFYLVDDRSWTEQKW